MTTKTIKNYLTNEGTVKEYFRGNYDEGNSSGVHNSNLFFVGETLYSYGYHFILAQLHNGYYFVNADGYSPSTGKHQSLVHQQCPNVRKIEIPFSALERAEIKISDIEVIDKENSKYVPVPRRVDGEDVMVDVHLMGSTLLKANGNYYLSGIDETAKDIWKGFFLTQLVEEVKTVEEAYESLKPEDVKILEGADIEVKRQGEYFFAKVVNGHTIEQLKKMQKLGSVNFGKKVSLEHENHDEGRTGWDFKQSRHVVTNYAKIDGMQYAYGTCRHSAGEHRMLKLDGWHLVIENVQVKSWSSDGRVD